MSESRALRFLDQLNQWWSELMWLGWMVGGKGICGGVLEFCGKKENATTTTAAAAAAAAAAAFSSSSSSSSSYYYYYYCCCCCCWFAKSLQTTTCLILKKNKCKSYGPNIVSINRMVFNARATTPLLEFYRILRSTSNLWNFHCITSHNLLLRPSSAGIFPRGVSTPGNPCAVMIQQQILWRFTTEIPKVLSWTRETKTLLNILSSLYSVLSFLYTNYYWLLISIK